MDVVEIALVERDLVDAWATHLASETAGTAVSLGRHCPACGSTRHGRPLVTGRPDVHVSLARAGAQAVVAAARVPVGIDAEQRGAVDADALAAADLPPAADPTLAWMTAEARGKLAGTGLRGPSRDGHMTTVAVGHGLVVVLATHAPVTVRFREVEGAPDGAATAPGTPHRPRR